MAKQQKTGAANAPKKKQTGFIISCAGGYVSRCGDGYELTPEPVQTFDKDEAETIAGELGEVYSVESAGDVE